MWSGAAWGLLVATSFAIAIKVVPLMQGWSSLVPAFVGVPIGLVVALASGAALSLFARGLVALPMRYRLALASSLLLLTFQIFTGTLTERLVPTLYVIGSSTALGGALGAFVQGRRERPSRLSRALGIVAFVCGAGAIAVGVRWLFGPGRGAAPLVDAAAVNAAQIAESDLPDPSAPGKYAVRKLYYGSGTDKRRPEYGPGVALRSTTADGRPFLRGWSGLDGWARSRYLGFGPSALPINGRMFYPEGEGPFPLAMVVHGAHRMNDPSDPGYDYLGEHLASHGIIFVSVDENFLNAGEWADIGVGLGGENAARGFLLLEHLRQIRGFSERAGTALHRKVDMTRIALLGHSRGGEAIAIAALYNRLSHAPDDALVKLDYNFGIRALVALSTTDKQYQPGGVGAHLSDVDFLALQGSNDGDVEYFQGMQQHDRVSLTGAGYHFKAAVYVHRANHGQWSRAWGSHDKSTFPKRLYFNRKPLLPAADQERVAKTYVTAFLSASLMGERRYLAFLRDHRVGRKWLPDTIYVTRFQDGQRRWVSRFEEDVDVTTPTIPGGRIAGEGLTVWREQPVGPASLWHALETRGVYLGWIASGGAAARYSIELPQGFETDAGSSLVFALADAHERPGPRAPRARGPSRQPIDLSVELADRKGHVARLPISSIRLLQPQIETTVWKPGFVSSQRREIVMQSYEMPLSRFVAVSPELDVGAIAAVRFVFDRTRAGVLALDDIGFAPGTTPAAAR